MNLSIRQLKIFVSLAHSLSFSRTADQFHLTQPRLSAIVGEIEEEVGVRLFDRTTRRVQVTPEGTALLVAAERLVDDYELGIERLSAVAREQASSLAIAALPTYASVLLPPVIMSLQQRTPSISLRVYDLPSDEAVDLLRAGKVELAITSLEAFPPDLTFEAFMHEHFVLVGTREALATAHLSEAIHWSEDVINRMNIISLAPGSSSFRHIDRAFRKNHLSFRPLFSLNSIVTAGAFVKAGLGIGLLPELSAVLLNDPDLKRIKLMGGPSRSIGIVSRRGETISPLGVAFIHALKEASNTGGNATLDDIVSISNMMNRQR
jgi:DNA-binding transcriptional LysR family regulator